MKKRHPMEILTDARLDELAERFDRQNLRRLLKIRFVDYIEDPERYDRVAEHLLAGGGLQGQDDGGSGRLKVIRLTLPHVDPRGRGLIVHTMN